MPAPPRGVGQFAWNIALCLAGLAGLALGARWLVAGAVEIARALDINELLIGLTVVAAGTSLPEAATSIVATIRGERDIAVGNVVGSNIFNILCILGVASVVAPSGIPISETVLGRDIPIAVAVAAVCFPIFLTHVSISRWEGLALFAYYVAYTAYLALAAMNSPALPAFVFVVGTIVLPVTIIGGGVRALMTVRHAPRANASSANRVHEYDRDDRPRK
jgi:cation:H+ antiporter